MLEALAELGIDASDHVPHGLDDERIGRADVIVGAMGGVFGKCYVILYFFLF